MAMVDSMATASLMSRSIQVQNAIQIAWNPTSDQTLKSQAFDFLNQLRSDPAAAHVCLSLFTRDPPLDEIIRHVSLEIVNNAIQTALLDTQRLQQIKDALFAYVQQRYGGPSSLAGSDSPTIQNKLSQTLTLVFEHLYISSWESFFDDLARLSAPASNSDNVGQAGTLLYLRVLSTIHDEIADQLINTSAPRQKLFTELKDVIRARDAAKIANSWREILTRRTEYHALVLEFCLKTIARWTSWTDISLIVTEAIMTQLFQVATEVVPADDIPRAKIRDAAIDVFAEIVAKKMKPAEKVELIGFINLDAVVTRLIASPELRDAQGSPRYDTDMAEAVAKLVNNAVLEIVRALDSGDASQESRAVAEQYLQRFVPHLLRFFADEYDEVCSTVIPSLTDLLSMLRRMSTLRGTLPEPYHPMLRPILDAIISKMRYDDTSIWGEDDDDARDGDDTDEAEFQELRKRLRVLQQIIATIDEKLYIGTLSNVITPGLLLIKSGAQNINWRDVDLAMVEMYLLGELALRNGGLYHKRKPSSAASEKMIELMPLMIESDVVSLNHPAIRLQYMETCIRQSDFFGQHPQHVAKVLEDFVAVVHSDQVKVRARSHHYFLRLTRDLKSQIGGFAERVIRAIEDLLVIKAELPDDSGNEDVSSNEDSQSADALFGGQLQLFEAVGCMAAAHSVPDTLQASLAKSIVEPLSFGIAQSIPSAAQGDERSLLQIHHYMMALGTLAKGFSDWAPGNTRPPVNDAVCAEFTSASEALLAALASTKSSLSVRSAARFAFSRMIGVLGYRVLDQLPRWIDGLLAESSTKDEMAMFLKLMDQIVFGFKTQIAAILDTLLTPLLQRIFGGLSEPTAGTDDEIQLGELRREYLNFFLVILNNDLEGVLVSATNQPIFETIIASIEHFTRDVNNSSDAKLAMAVLTKMSLVWGGPDIPFPATNQALPKPTLPGFDRFMVTRFSSLTWQLMGSASFDPKEANANRVLGEIANLQQSILAKTGQEYLSWVRDVELKGLGVQGLLADEYVAALANKEPKAFKAFLVKFLQQGRSGG